MKSEKTQQRAQNILKMLVEHYIDDGQPVGSKTLSNNPDLNVSSATIRSIMADLERQGYLRSMHTSSGRVPTEKGYRLFVDSLLTIKPTESQQIKVIQQAINAHSSSQELVASAPSLLSNMTKFAGIVSLPKQPSITFKHVEFLKLSSKKLLVILVVNGQEVQNRIIETEVEFNQSQLEYAANFINQNYQNKPLNDIKQALVEAMQDDRETIDELMKNSIELANQAIDSSDQSSSFVVDGQTNLLDFIENPDIKKIKHLLEAFHAKQSMLHLMDKCVASDGLQMFIGKESGFDLFDDFSIVTAPYGINDNIVGVLGVIGPTRMHYEKVIPLVDITAKLMSNALTKHNR